MDPPIAPGWVLPSQPQHQLAEFGRQGRTATPVRIGPAAPDQIPMPPQQRRRPHEEAPPDRAVQQPCEPGQHRPVGPVNSRPGHLAPQHRDLVAQHE